MTFSLIVSTFVSMFLTERSGLQVFCCRFVVRLLGRCSSSSGFRFPTGSGTVGRTETPRAYFRHRRFCQHVHRGQKLSSQIDASRSRSMKHACGHVSLCCLARRNSFFSFFVWALTGPRLHYRHCQVTAIFTNFSLNRF